MGNEGSTMSIEPDQLLAAMQWAEDSPLIDVDNRSCHFYISNESSFAMRPIGSQMIEGHVDQSPPDIISPGEWAECVLRRTDRISFLGSWGNLQFEMTEPSTRTKAKLVLGARKAYPACEPPRVGAEFFRLGQSADDDKKIVQTTKSCSRQMEVGPKLRIVEASVTFNSVSMMEGLFVVTEGSALATRSGRCGRMTRTPGMQPSAGMAMTPGMARAAGMKKVAGMLRVYLGKKNYGVDIDKVCAAVLSCAALAAGVVLTVVTSGAAGLVISSALISFGTDSLSATLREDFSWAEWASAGATGAAVSLITFGAGFATAGGVAEALLLRGAVGLAADHVEAIASTAGALVASGVRTGAVHVFASARGENLSAFGLLAEGLQGLGDGSAGAMAALALRFVDVARGGAAVEAFANAEEDYVLVRPQRGPLFLGCIMSKAEDSGAGVSSAERALNENTAALRKFVPDLQKIHGEGGNAVYAGIYHQKKTLYIVGHTLDVWGLGPEALASLVCDNPALRQPVDAVVLASCKMAQDEEFCQKLSDLLRQQGMGQAPLLAFQDVCSFWSRTPEPVVNCACSGDSITIIDGPRGYYPEGSIWFF